MARDFNQNRIANAILKKGTIAGYGNHWAYKDKADGFNVVNVTVPNIPLNVKQYLEGDEDLTIYGIGTDVSKLCAYSLASFPKLEKVYLLNYTDMITLETNWDGNLVYLDEIYVPESLLSRYQMEYPNETRFKILVEQATLEIPYIDTDILTTEYVDTIIAGLLESSLPLITKVVIDDRFTQESADYIAWNYDFSVLTNLNNNIWYGTTKYDFSVLTISGSGALTNAMVEQAIEEVPSSKRSAITKVVVSSGLTLNTSDSAGCLDVCDTYLPNVTTLELNQPIDRQNTGIKPYSNITNSNNKFINIIFNYSSLPSQAFNGTYIKYFESNTITTIPYESCFATSKIEDIKVPNVTVINYRAFASSMLGYNGVYILFEKAEWLREGFIFFNAQISRLFLPKINKIDDNAFYGVSGKIFISTNDCQLLGVLGIGGKTFYFKAIDLTSYKVATNWSNYSSDMIGIIDGGNTYANIKNRGVSMNYPTLTGVDTEANIQLLTPADNSLYLASDTGNLWQYDSGNSQWVNLFANLTDIVWYSDEDCTTTVLPSAMDTSHTYYVKGTLIGYDFANDSWANIKLAYERGVAHYNLGDIKTITYNNSTYTIRICDIGDRYDIVNGNGAKNHITCEFVEVITTAKMNSTATNNGGFALSDMHTTVLPAIYNDLPSDLKAVISQVSVASASDGSASGSGSLSYSDNYLFLPNNYELYGNRGNSNALEQTTEFDLYYQNNNDNFRVKNYNNVANNYWLRSPRVSNTVSFIFVTTLGYSNDNFATTNVGVAPFFCI